jgi:hypothetical protein
MLQELPTELLLLIFGYLNPDSAYAFGQISKSHNKISKSPYARAQLLSNYYGKVKAFYYGYTNHRLLLDGILANVMYNFDCKLPRFVAQLVVKDVSI